MNDLSSLLADATEQAKPTKPPLPANGLERIQAQWEDLTDDPFDFGSIQRLLNIAKSAGGGARTVGIVFDEVHLTGNKSHNLSEQIETKLRGRLAVTSAPPSGARSVPTYHDPTPEPEQVEPEEAKRRAFLVLVAWAKTLGLVRTINPGGIPVPLLEVAVRDGTLCIGDQTATDYYDNHPECVG